jgi:integrase
MARGSIVKRKSGSYAIRYWDENGRRHYETIGASRRDAERALTTRLAELQTGAWRPPSQETLSAYAERWLERRDPKNSGDLKEGRYTRTRLSHSTHREYQRSLELYILPSLGRRPLSQITPADVDQLIARMEHEGRAGWTIRNAIGPLRALLADAARHGLIQTNPALNPDLPPVQEHAGKELPQTATQAIRKALLALAATDPLLGEPDMHAVCLFDLALGTGLRQGELRALQWSDIEREPRLLRVERAYSRDILKRPKSRAGIRTVPIFDSVRAALDTLAARALEYGIYAPEQLLFQTEHGGPLHASNFNRRTWQPALRHAGLVDTNGKTIYRFHDLRHTCISRLVAAGADIKLIQAIAGHANATITLNRYSHLLDERLTDVATRYDPVTTPR